MSRYSGKREISLYGGYVKMSLYYRRKWVLVYIAPMQSGSNNDDYDNRTQCSNFLLPYSTLSCKRRLTFSKCQRLWDENSWSAAGECMEMCWRGKGLSLPATTGTWRRGLSVLIAKICLLSDGPPAVNQYDVPPTDTLNSHTAKQLIWSIAGYV